MKFIALNRLGLIGENRSQKLHCLVMGMVTETDSGERIAADEAVAETVTGAGVEEPPETGGIAWITWSVRGKS